MNITIDGQVYDASTLSEEAKAQINSLKAADIRLNELKRDTAMIMTARNIYAAELKKELVKTQAQPKVASPKEVTNTSDVKPEKSKTRKSVSSEG